jgi:hypothetical protein
VLFLDELFFFLLEDFLVDVEVEVDDAGLVSVDFAGAASVFFAGAFVGAGAAAWASMPIGSASAALIARAFMRAFFISSFSFSPRSLMPGLEGNDREAPVNRT